VVVVVCLLTVIASTFDPSTQREGYGSNISYIPMHFIHPHKERDVVVI